MAEFITGTALNLALENMIKYADNYLWLISPYIKLHDRIKDELKKKRENHNLEIVIVFGKNEGDLTKSLSNEDFLFLKDFTNVKICYEKNLHAKFYASEDFSLVTSMNLHQFSQNTNVEAGIKMYPQNALKQIVDRATNSYDAGDDAIVYFDSIIEHSEVMFKRTAIYEKGFLNMSKKYINSETEIDLISKQSKPIYNDKESKSKNSYSKPYQSPEQTLGYCIRTGQQIPFDSSRPFSYESYKI
jgi:PLD-like domain